MLAVASTLLPMTGMAAERLASMEQYTVRAPLKTSQNLLEFWLDEDGIQHANLCPTTAPCTTVAPDGDYVTAHDLKITLLKGEIHLDGQEYSECAYGAVTKDKMPEYTFAKSADAQEYITCEDRD